MMQIYLVGGAVRDALLGLEVSDRDYVVVGGSVRQMLAQGFTPVGKDFPVFLHPRTKAEYALARQERKVGEGYTGFTFNTHSSVTLEEDLLRRDLTINAMAQDDSGNIVDPYGGQADLHNKILRHVSPAFSEDPLRILRVARFYARFRPLGFSVAPDTQVLLKEMIAQGVLNELAAPRVWQELLKVLQEPEPAAFFELLHELGGLTPWFAELTSEIIFSPSWQAQLMLVQREHNNIVKVPVLVAPLNSAEQNAFCQRLPVPNEITDIITLGQEVNQQLRDYAKLGADELVDLLYRVDVMRRPGRLQVLISIARVCHSELSDMRTFFTKAEQVLRSIKASDLIAQGHQGAAIKTALRDAHINKIQSFIAQ